MIRAKGRYRNQAVELGQPLALEEGAEVEVDIHLANEHEGWTELGMSRLEEDWDNPQDAVYDNWKKLYRVEPR